MNKILLYIFLVLLLVPVSHSANLKNWDIELTTNNQIVNWEITLEFYENVTTSDYFVMSRIQNSAVFIDNNNVICDVNERDLGTSIVCNNIFTNKITYRFDTNDPSDFLGDLRIFRYSVPITQTAGNFSVIAKLPLGSFLIDESKLSEGYFPYTPTFGREGSDGRRIYIEWNIENPKVGETFNVSFIYENIIEISPIIVVLLLIIVSPIIIFMLFFRKSKLKDLLPVLEEGEREVMRILLREKKSVDQRSIVKETDFSKSKVSRIIQDLLKRGLIEKTPKGRTNIISLKKHIKTEKKESENKK